jgi:hypothetical protein
MWPSIRYMLKSTFVPQYALTPVSQGIWKNHRGLFYSNWYLFGLCVLRLPRIDIG